MSGLDKLDIPVNNGDFETVPVGTMAKLEELVDKCNALAMRYRDLED